MRVAVVGAGPAGLTAAYRLAVAGADVDVFEGSDAVGGMARSLDLWGQRVDVGPHRFFSKDPRVNKLWLELIGRDYCMIDRQTRILYRGRLYDYPLRAGNALANLGVAEAAACVASYAADRTEPYQLGDGYGHLAVVVDDLAAEHARFAREDLAPGPLRELQHGGAVLARFFFATDPDGYKIEVIQKGGRFG